MQSSRSYWQPAPRVSAGRLGVATKLTS
jgi:hypothetical protein